MFNNISGKLKTFAKVLAWLGIGYSVLVGAFSIFALYQPLIGIAWIVLGSFLSWVLSSVLFAFGDLIEKTSGIHDHFCGNKNAAAAADSACAAAGVEYTHQLSNAVLTTETKAAIYAAVAEVMGTSVSGLRVHSIKCLATQPVSGQQVDEGVKIAITAAIAETMGESVSGLRLHSISKI